MTNMPETSTQLKRLHVPNDLSATAIRDISAALNVLLADVFTPYLKTKELERRIDTLLDAFASGVLTGPSV